LASFANESGLSSDLALKATCGFGGGFAGLGGPCGAVTGAMMVIGFRYGKDKPEDEEAEVKTYRMVREFVRRFEQCHKTTLCRDLLKVDIGTLEGLRAALDKGLFTTVCPEFVKSAVEILEELLT
jgi:C_GCAxxG_C_C family probable redox protein